MDDGCTLSQLRATIQSKFGIPNDDQTLSLQQGLLTSKDPSSFDDLAPGRRNDGKPLATLGWSTDPSSTASTPSRASPPPLWPRSIAANSRVER